MPSIPVYLGAFLATLFLIQILRRPAAQIGLVDVPGGRKNHDGHVPVVGGLAMFGAFAFAAVMADGPLLHHASLLAALLLLVAVGVLDDLHDLSAHSRFLAQILAAVFMTSWGGVHLDSLGDLMGAGEVQIHEWAIPFTVFCVLGVINALNMSDGLDGLGGGLAFFAFAWFAVAAAVAGKAAEAAFLGLFLSVVLGFLVFNLRTPWRSRATVFMGDAGSMMLGFALAWFAVELSQGEGRAIRPITAVWVLGLPLMDTVSLMLRRMLKGKSPFSADREHLHHIFLAAGYSVPQTVAILLAASTLLGGIGVVAGHLGVPDHLMFYAFLGLFALYCLAVAYAWKLMKLAKRIRG